MTPAEQQSPPESFEDIALIGMSCIFPGADSPQQFWQNIINKVDCITDAPPDWDPGSYYDASNTISDRTYTTKGGFLGDMCRFNAVKYGVPPSNIDGAEPDQFIALRCAFEALADAGVPEIPLNRNKTSVIFGRGIFVNRGWVTVFQRSLTVEHVIDVLRQLEPDRTVDDLNYIRVELKRFLPPANADTFPGIVHNVLAGRIANRFDLMGPSYNVDGACASALLAMNHGIQDLRAGRCDAVLAGGSQVSTPGPVHVMFCQLQALSRTGKIAPFSAAANGTLLSQGCGIVVLKRRSDAERDGNRIYALIKSIGVSSDGNGVGLLAPRTEGQQLAIERAYAEHNLSPDSVSLIEAHGTGLPLGDATEISSLKAAFGPQKNGRPDVAVGSIKSMLGHMLPAAGVGSMIKTALALYHRVLPPTLHAEEPNPDFKFDQSRFYLPTEPRPWLHHRNDIGRRAGINAFGFGGINAHAVLEEYPHDEAGLTNFECQWPSELIVVSGINLADLHKNLTELSGWLKQSAEPRLLDIAATCAERTGNSSISIVANDVPDLIKKLDHAIKLLSEPGRQRIQDRSGIFWQSEPLARSGRVAIMFPGEGCQYANMLADLCRHFPEVRQEFELTAGALAQRGVSLAHILFPQPAAAKAVQNDLLQMELAVATVTAAARGLLRLLDRLQVKADAMVGHSSGEYASLLASGTCGQPDTEQLMQIVIDGVDSAAALQQSNLVPEAVLVAAGGVPPEVLDDAVAASNGEVVVAMDNCPHQRILVGSEAAIAAVLQQLQGKGGICQRLEWNRPYHTAAFEPGSKIVEQYIEKLGLDAPKIELWSCATTQPFPSDPEEVRKLAVQQWSSPVRFRETILAMYEAGVRVFVEAGPRGNLSAFVADTLGDRPHAVVPMAVSNKADLVQLCHAVGLLVACGVPVKLSELYDRRRPIQLDLSKPLPAPMREPILRTDLPKFKLNDEVGQRWRANRKAPPAVDATRHPVEPSKGVPKTLPAKPIVLPANGQPKVNAGVSARGAMYQEFQRTMQQYLHTQETFAAAMMNRRQDDPSNGKVHSDAKIFPTPTSLTPSASLPAPQAMPRVVTNEMPASGNSAAQNYPALRLDGQVKQKQSMNSANSAAELTSEKAKSYRHPFIETILEFKQGERLVAECELSIAKHPFLADHTFFGRHISDEDIDLRALPVMPMVMTLELLAEGAATLFPDAAVCAICDIRASGWLTCPGHSRRVRIEAVAQQDGLVHVAVLAADVDGHPEIAAGNVELGSRPKTLGSIRFSDLNQSPPPWQPDAVYNYLLYHGPSFQGIEEFEDFGPKGLRCRARSPQVQLLRDRPNSDLLLPVALIDTASQVPGIVNANYMALGKWTPLAFPNTIGRLEISAAAWNDEQFVINAAIEQTSEKLFSDTEVRRADGQVVIRYLQRVEELLDFPLKLYLYALSSQSARLAVPLDGLFEGVRGIEHCRICQAFEAGNRMLVKSHWAQVLAHLVLDRIERQEFDRLKSAPVALAQWLLGRIAIKEAVGQRADLLRRLADIHIEQTPGGKCCAVLRDREPLYVSLAQQMFFTVAASGSAEVLSGLGIGLAPLRTMDNDLRDAAFEAAEIAVLQSSASDDCTEETLIRACRAAKTAFLQAIDGNSRAELRSIKLHDVDIGRRSFSLVMNETATNPQRPRDPAVKNRNRGQTVAGTIEAGDHFAEVHWRTHEDHVLALCLIHRDPNH